MNTLEAIHRRRSIRRFRPDPVPEELLTKILEAARRAPSGTNAQPWKFVVVRSPERREALAEAAYGQAMFHQAPVIVVALGDRKVYKRRMRRAKELIDVGAIDAEVIEKLGNVYRNRATQTLEPDQAIMANCMIAVDHLILAATDLGLGTCWVRFMKVEEIAAALGLPEEVFPIVMIPLGYADEDPPSRPRYPLDEVAFAEDLDHPWPAEVTEDGA
ncbi:MAG: nitroreductase family protein [Pirellulales bacterium]|nr:nitroreductase family protein [Pirellulales bacterium]